MATNTFGTESATGVDSLLRFDGHNWLLTPAGQNVPVIMGSLLLILDKYEVGYWYHPEIHCH